MEYIPGETLTDRIASGSLSEEAITRLGSQLVDGLAAAHSQGLVHRDLKPGNIRITPDGLVKILDFGLARSTQSPGTDSVTETVTELHGVAGTLPYMAPEQLAGQRVDARTDIYALGTVLYEMATGRRPFGTADGIRLMAAILQRPPDPPSGVNRHLSPEIENIVLKALEKSPDLRYQSVKELGVDLNRLGRPHPVAARPGRVVSRRRLVGISVAAVAALLVGLNLGALLDLLPGLSQRRARSVAVLPLENVSGDPDQDYFAAGMTEALIADLGQISALRVIAGRSTRRYTDTELSVAEIAQALHVDAVVEGSAQRQGQEAGVTVRVVDAATQEQLWSQTYQRDFSNLLVLQGELAQTIAREIQVAISPEEELRLAARQAVERETYEAYLRGMFLMNKSTLAEREQSIAYFQDAVEKNPADPLAYAGLALGHAMLAHGPTVRADDNWALARAAAERALRLDEGLSEAHAAVADIKLYYEWDWDGAERAFDRALELNPSLALTHYHLAWMHILFGRWDEAIAEHQRAVDLDPLTPLHTGWFGGLYLWAGDVEKAIAYAEESLAIRPNFAVGLHILAVAYTAQERHDEAVATGERLAQVAPVWRWAVGRTYAAAGRNCDGDRQRDQL